MRPPGTGAKTGTLYDQYLAIVRAPACASARSGCSGLVTVLGDHTYWGLLGRHARGLSSGPSAAKVRYDMTARDRLDSQAGRLLNSQHGAALEGAVEIGLACIQHTFDTDTQGTCIQRQFIANPSSTQALPRE